MEKRETENKNDNANRLKSLKINIPTNLYSMCSAPLHVPLWILTAFAALCVSSFVSHRKEKIYCSRIPHLSPL